MVGISTRRTLKRVVLLTVVLLLWLLSSFYSFSSLHRNIISNDAEPPPVLPVSRTSSATIVLQPEQDEQERPAIIVLRTPVFPEGPGSVGWNPRRDSGQDVLMTFREFNCQTKASILSVLKFVRPTPSMIHVVIKEARQHCPALEKLAPGKVTCYTAKVLFFLA